MFSAWCRWGSPYYFMLRERAGRHMVARAHRFVVHMSGTRGGGAGLVWRSRARSAAARVRRAAERRGAAVEHTGARADGAARLRALTPRRPSPPAPRPAHPAHPSPRTAQAHARYVGHEIFRLALSARRAVNRWRHAGAPPRTDDITATTTATATHTTTQTTLTYTYLNIPIFRIQN